MLEESKRRRRDRKRNYKRGRGASESKLSLDNMVRAPCCEKMGLKKGPWTPEEDEILVAYIQGYGHGNWRALPKQAGLLRCGKSCRLRWMNYLRPDIKRGNFTKEEEEAIIRLHEMLGNRWSAIAAKLPGRTDNEIKNVWHTHLKKLVNPNTSSTESKKKRKDCSRTSTKKVSSEHVTAQLDEDSSNARYDEYARLIMHSASPEQSYSDFSSCATDTSTASAEISNDVGAKEEAAEIDESFWLDALSMDDSAASMDFTTLELPLPTTTSDYCNLFGSSDIDDMDFWRKVFMEVGDLQ